MEFSKRMFPGRSQSAITTTRNLLFQPGPSRKAEFAGVIVPQTLAFPFEGKTCRQSDPDRLEDVLHLLLVERRSVGA